MQSLLSGNRLVLIVVLTLAATPYFLRLGASSLWDSNEAFYAETPREMIESGDYINPTFNYQPRFNKPPLSYWVVAGLYKLFGVSESVERLAIALAALVMIATAYGLGRCAFSREAGLLAAIGLAASPRFLMFSRRIMIDVYLAMFMALALLLFMLAERHPERRRFYLAAMYASIGLGILTKGPVAALLPGLAVLIYLAVYRKLKEISRLMLPMGVAIVALIVLPWYLAVYLQHGVGYIASFILRDNLSRYAQQAWGPGRGPLFYVGVIAGDFFPWSLFLAPALWFEIRRRLGRRQGSKDETAPAAQINSKAPAQSATTEVAQDRHVALLIIWIAVIVVFFSFSRSKEDLYILPIYPAAAALAGILVARWFTPAPALNVPLQVTTAILAVVLLTAGAIVLYLFGGAQGYQLRGATAVGLIAVAGGLITIGSLCAMKRRLAVLASVTSVILFNWIFALWTLPDFERYKPVRALCEIASAKPADALVGYYRLASPSMTFYLRRPIFEYYLPEEISAAFSSGRDVYCVMTAAEYDSLDQELRARTHVLARRPMFQVKLKGIFDRAEPPQVLLVSNKDGVSSAQ
ncbi:MAG: glycosyltransferase family 39 protein [Acidobacteriota bacterium]